MVFGSRPFDNGKRPTPELKSSPIDFSGCQPAPDARQPGLPFARRIALGFVLAPPLRPVSGGSYPINRRALALPYFYALGASIQNDSALPQGRAARCVLG
jgi:hypothetical protein